MTESVGTPLFWTGFLTVVLLLLSLDLGVLHRKAHVVKPREALIWSIVWILLSAAFGTWIYFHMGPEKGLEFFTGYLIEYALSVDNVFVFILIFSYFSVPGHLHHRVLFWGILGALVMRGVMIIAGASLLESFHWVIFIFGGIIILSGIKMLVQRHEELHPERNPVVRLVRRFFPVTSE